MAPPPPFVAAWHAVSVADPSSPLPSSDPHDPAARLRLRYERPAREWTEALPLGNGRLGAMVFGGAEVERLQLNEGTLWAGGPYTPNNPEALEAFPVVRRLLFEGRFREAHDLAEARMMARPLTQMPYQTAGDLHLTMPALGDVTAYGRELDLDSAIAQTLFTAGGVRYVREALASAVDGVLAVRLSCDVPGRIALDVSLGAPQRVAATTAEGNGVVLRGANEPAAGIDGKLAFEVRAQVVAEGGSRSASGGVLAIRGADSVVVLVSIATSFRSPTDVSGDPAAVTQRAIAQAARKGYDRVRADHVAEHRQLFRRVAIDLGATAAVHRPTDERVSRSSQTDDPDLAALYFQYGRYLLLSCSRPGGQAATLQGLWNDFLDPPWGCKYTININTEMNYWPAEPAHLPECMEPLFALVEELARTGAETARVHYGAGGWVAHHNTDLWRAAAPVDGAQWGLWPTGGAWLCLTLWDSYDYGRDPAVLARLYPLLKGSAQFFLDTLVAEPKRGWLVTCPSLSPENTHPGGTSLCAGPTMDAQILRDLFGRCIAAANALDVDVALVERWRDARARLPPHQIGGAGHLQEWLEDWDLDAPERHHRHVSHLFGVYPSDQITPRATPELAAAARKSLDVRGDDATGWGLAWRLALWARLADGERAHAILRRLLEPDRTYPNLFDAHPPFQIDGNFGAVAGIMELLVQSHGGVVELLPGLPRAWPSGSVRGLRARGGFGVDIAWRDGRLDVAVVRGRAGERGRLRCGPHEVDFVVPASGELTVRHDDAGLALG
jgi:alpha-L-fucosidase 2